MSKDTEIKDRKLDHIKINLEKDVRSALSTGLENVSLCSRGASRA